MENTWPALIFVLLGLFTTVYSVVEAQPQIGFGWIPTQVVGLVAIAALLIGTVLLINPLSLAQIFKLIIGIGALGALNAMYLTYAHFTTAGAICPAPVDGYIACDIVNQSLWSEILGIPVAALGIGFYMTVMIVAALSLHQLHSLPSHKAQKDALHRPLLVILAIGGLAFTAWLNYAQFIELMTLCALCEFSASMVLVLLASSIISLRK